jgi:hypothetical protein
MATTNKNYNYGRRACTEVPGGYDGGAGYEDAIDINNLPDKEEDNQAMPEDLDDIDFDNYKGIYANDDNNQKY